MGRRAAALIPADPAPASPPRRGGQPAGQAGRRETSPVPEQYRAGEDQALRAVGRGALPHPEGILGAVQGGRRTRGRAVASGQCPGCPGRPDPGEGDSWGWAPVSQSSSGSCKVFKMLAAGRLVLGNQATEALQDLAEWCFQQGCRHTPRHCPPVGVFEGFPPSPLLFLTHKW